MYNDEHTELEAVCTFKLIGQIAYSMFSLNILRFTRVCVQSFISKLEAVCIFKLRGQKITMSDIRT